MEFNNKLTQYEIEKLGVINNVNKLQQTDNTNNISEHKLEEKNTHEVKYFNVLTDGFHFWVSVRDMQDICTQISVSQLEEIGVKLNPEMVFGEPYVNTNDEFLIYVQKNTNNPKHVPRLGLLATKNMDYNYEEIDNREQGLSL